MYIHDRMIFQLCFAYDFNTPILANSAAFYLIPVSLSENDALVPSLMECGKSWQIFFVFFSFLQSLVFNRSPNSLIILGCVVQFESQKLGIVLFPFPLHLPLDLSASLTCTVSAINLNPLHVYYLVSHTKKKYTVYILFTNLTFDINIENTCIIYPHIEDSRKTL